MRVKFNTWRGLKEMDLSEALTPSESRDGRLEQAQALAERNAECIGRIVAFLVETNVCTLEQARQLVGVYNDIVLIE